jgi:hypothetical protein
MNIFFRLLYIQFQLNQAHTWTEKRIVVGALGGEVDRKLSTFY